MYTYTYIYTNIYTYRHEAKLIQICTYVYICMYLHYFLSLGCAATVSTGCMGARALRIAAPCTHSWETFSSFVARNRKGD